MWCEVGRIAESRRKPAYGIWQGIVTGEERVGFSDDKKAESVGLGV